MSKIDLYENGGKYFWVRIGVSSTAADGHVNQPAPEITDDLLLKAEYVGQIPAGAKKVAEWNNKRKVGWVTTLDVPIRQQFLVDGIGLGNDYTKVMSKIDLYENGGKYFWVHT